MSKPKVIERINTQDDILDAKINDCLQYRKTIKSLTEIDKDGYYYVDGGDDTFPYVYGILTVKTTPLGAKSVIYESLGTDKKLYKNMLRVGQSIWEGWQQITTNDIISIMLNSVATPDANNMTESRTYRMSVGTNMPYADDWVIENGVFNSAYKTCIATSRRAKETWQGIYYNNVWSWQQMATTTKTPFSCTAATGYEIIWQDCYELNGIKHIHLRVKKTDNTVFETVQHHIFKVPFSTANTITPLNIMPYLNSSFTTMGTTQSNGVLWNNNNGYITPTTASAYGFEIKCDYEY